jgi:nicotinate-nucleotide adenylyltransferase
MAGAARAALGLDRVLFSVSPRPPHKRDESTSPFSRRLEMVRLATEGVEGVAVTRIEEPHDPSYTVDLLRACHFRTSADLYFLVGADSLAELPGWKDPGEIVRLCTVVVFPREHAPVVLKVPGEASLVVFESPVIDVSSTEVRLRIHAGDPAGDSLPAGVADYIARHGLYRPSR